MIKFSYQKNANSQNKSKNTISNDMSMSSSSIKIPLMEKFDKIEQPSKKR